MMKFEVLNPADRFKAAEASQCWLPQTNTYTETSHMNQDNINSSQWYKKRNRKLVWGGRGFVNIGDELSITWDGFQNREQLLLIQEWKHANAIKKKEQKTDKPELILNQLDNVMKIFILYMNTAWGKKSRCPATLSHVSVSAAATRSSK